jgi:hypothetical protein
MPDITMCRPEIYSKEKCPLADTCYRHRATPDKIQSFFTEPPYDKKKKNCEYYWECSASPKNLKKARRRR